jgi:hypothetical protein
MHDFLIRTLSALEQWLTGESSKSAQAERSGGLVPAHVKALEYDHYIRSNVGGNEAR